MNIRLDKTISQIGGGALISITECGFAAGGLMRCCEKTLAELESQGKEVAIDEVLACRYCRGQMKVKAGPHYPLISHHYQEVK